MSIKKYFAESDSGSYLEINEDSVIADVRNNLFGIVDAYGGTGIGDTLSEIVKSSLMKSFGILSEDEDATLPLYYHPNYSIETNALINSLKLAHLKVKEFNAQKESSSRGGASFLGCVSGDKTIQLVGVGNCMALTQKGSSISISYYPHSSSNIPVIGGAGAENFPHSGLGLFEDLEFFVQEVKINNGNKVFLLSSGAYAPFNLTELSILIQEFNSDVEQLKQELAQIASGRGFKGNQSIVCLEF